jgi:hypothetical protein
LVASADFVLRRVEAFLDGPAGADDADQFGQGHVAGAFKRDFCQLFCLPCS